MDGGFRLLGQQLLRPRIGIIKNPGQITGHVVDIVEENGLISDLTVIRAHNPENIPALMAGWNGIIILGARTNVHPSNYGEVPDPDVVQEFDLERDSRTLPLIRAAVQQEIPVLAICRGFQEMNVAFEGKLQQKVNDMHLHVDPNNKQNREYAYSYAHNIMLADHEMCRRLVDAREIPVNSLHRQGVPMAGKFLGNGLVPLGWSKDGLVEMATIDPKVLGNGWVLGVQPHPDKRRKGQEAFAKAIFSAFAEAANDNFARMTGQPYLPRVTTLLHPCVHVAA